MRANRLGLGILGAVLGFAVSTAAVEARAANFTIAPGPEGEDVAPYAFIPFLERGGPGYVTLYAFDASDAQGLNHEFQSYLKFPLPANLLGPGETVTLAVFTIAYAFDFVGYGDTSGIPGQIDLRTVLAPWSEPTLTWNNKPAVGPVVASVGGITSYQTLQFNVTNTVRQWATGVLPNHGIALTSSAGRVIGFHSFEAAAAGSLKGRLLIQTGPAGSDMDSDGVLDAGDNCPLNANPLQENTDGDTVGDVCDNQCIPGATTSITSVAPASGLGSWPGNWIGLVGTGFGPNADARVGGVSVEFDRSSSPPRAHLPTTLAAGTYSVAVVNPEGCRSLEAATVVVKAAGSCGLLGIEGAAALGAIRLVRRRNRSAGRSC